MKNRLLHIISLATIDRPVLSSWLEKTLEVSGAEVRVMVGELRREGNLIGSNKQGYWTPRTPHEADIGVGHMRERALSMLKTYRLQKRARHRRFGAQIELL